MYSAFNGRISDTNEKEPVEVEFIGKFNKLQDDCTMLNQMIEQMLLTSGICKRYTGEPAYCSFGPNTTISKSTTVNQNTGHQRETGLQNLAASCHGTDDTVTRGAVGSKINSSTNLRDTVNTKTSIYDNMENVKNGEKLFISTSDNTVTQYEDTNTTKEPSQSSTTKPTSIPQYQNTIRRLSSQTKDTLRPISTKRQRPTSGYGNRIRSYNAYVNQRIRPGSSLRRSTTSFRGRVLSAPSRMPPYRWLPKVTVPVPFKMTLRDQNRPKSTYSKRFIEQMLREERQKELLEIKERQKQFKARPVPSTTYASNNSFYIGKLRRSKSAHPSTRRKPSLTQHKVIKARPPPLSTYIPPKLKQPNKEKTIQRAITTLTKAHEPGHMAEHSIKWKVQQRLRHVPQCYVSKELVPRVRSSSVPDFRKLHLDFELQLDEVRRSRPITLTEPFKFQTDYNRHYCANWTFPNEQELIKTKHMDFV
ncbi:unnamed protein product [Bursaphelenchus okinawaensis]|uniref:Uncharacterized protein n=1 Tax=Bursaphelenchus okinawaensis TaxID=465554 RepID=A0A811LBY4_9BILA|nr:unnamed protein product [Bursaphelenchus okinawaensis]CAG9121206.1 unnamed protein product [Bursaphelenchus okinawaensis]